MIKIKRDLIRDLNIILGSKIKWYKKKSFDLFFYTLKLLVIISNNPLCVWKSEDSVVYCMKYR